MILHDVEQRSPEWYALRKGIPTASEFDAIITAVKGDPCSDKIQRGLIAKLIDEVVHPAEPEAFQGNAHTERGNLLEDDAAALYAAMTDEDVWKIGFITNLGAGCSPDRLVGDNGGLEIKCPAGKTHVGYLMDGVLPDAYKQQVHGSLVVSGREWWDFMSYCPGYRPLIVRVTRDEYTEKLEKALVDFVAKKNEWLRKVTEEE